MKNFYRDGGLALSIIALLIVSGALAGAVYRLDSRLFWIFAPFIVLTAGFTIGKLVWATRKRFQYLSVVNNEIELANSVSLYSFPVSIAIIDRERRFVWFNEGFSRDFKSCASYGNSLDVITTASADLLLSQGGARIKYNDKYYKISATAPKEDGAGEIFIVYLEDITREIVLDLEKKSSQPVVIIFMIDSYEDIFDKGSESASASVIVKIDKLLEDYIKTASGVIRKTGRDRFWAVVENRYVDLLIENKVKLLDKAREIAVTDRISVTLSIGIGKTGKDLAESEAFARQALEMALGRGGDQAAIKTKAGFEFYGGVSKGVERRAKSRVRIIANSLVDLANASDIVYIMGHKYSDLDSIGSAVGIACGLRNLGRPAYIVIDKASTLGLSLIERVEQAEKAEKPDLKENERAPLFISAEKAKDAWTENSLLIIVDTHNKKLLEDKELYQEAQKVVVIDHHRKMVDFIDNAAIFHHEVSASSSSEMVAELLQFFGEAGMINASQAEALLAGIMLDTKKFSLKTGARTFEAAAFLRKLGADTVNVKSLFANTIENYKQKIALVSNAEVYRKCAIACAEIPVEDIRIIAPQAADELLEISGVDASFLIYRTVSGGGGEVSLSARSLGALNVQIIAEALGGGGHQTMAGAQFKERSVSDVERMLRGVIDKYYETVEG